MYSCLSSNLQVFGVQKYVIAVKQEPMKKKKKKSFNVLFLICPYKWQDVTSTCTSIVYKDVIALSSNV